MLIVEKEDEKEKHKGEERKMKCIYSLINGLLEKETINTSRVRGGSEGRQARRQGMRKGRRERDIILIKNSKTQRKADIGVR